MKISSKSLLNFKIPFTYFTLHVQPRLFSSSFSDAAVAEHDILLLANLHKNADTLSLPCIFRWSTSSIVLSLPSSPQLVFNFVTFFQNNFFSQIFFTEHKNFSTKVYSKSFYFTQQVGKIFPKLFC